jgi:hypothetical protein
VLRRSVSEVTVLFPGVRVRTEIAEGLAARVLLDQAAEADLLVLGRTAYGPDPYRAAGPVIRACLRASPCPVVIIGSEQKVPSDSLPPQAAEDRRAAPHRTDHVPESWQRHLQGTGAAR